MRAASSGWLARRERVGDHFTRGAKRWTTLTSDVPVTGIRATVRAGRHQMRETLLSWLPDDLSGERILDAGCGTGVFSLELAARGAEVVGVDLAEELIEAAHERARLTPGPRPEFIAGDLFEVAREREFTRMIAMDCFIHYELAETLEALQLMSSAAPRGLYFTVAPWTPLLAMMHLAGRLFPSDHKAPPIVPVKGAHLDAAIRSADEFARWECTRSHVVHTGFYISRGVALEPSGSQAVTSPA
jgi:magnesium-protoporphyrin O-methyltransferase